MGLVACEKTPTSQTPAAPTENLPIYANNTRPRVQIYISEGTDAGMSKMDVCAKSISTQEENCIKLAKGNENNFDVIMYLNPDKYILYRKIYKNDGKVSNTIDYHTNIESAYENMGTVYGIRKIQIVDVKANSRHVIVFDDFGRIGENAEHPFPDPWQIWDCGWNYPGCYEEPPNKF